MVIQSSSANTFSVTTSNTKIADQCIASVRRTMLVITNLNAGFVYLNKNNTQPAVVGAGIPLAQNQSWIEATDAGSQCWQGAVQCIGSGTNSVSVSESFETPEPR